MVYAIFTFLSGISLTAIPMTTNKLILSALTATYGFTIAANYSLVSAILVNLISLDNFTQSYGLLLLIQGIGSLLGPPVAGKYFFHIFSNFLFLISFLEQVGFLTFLELMILHSTLREFVSHSPV